jgi:hypothetical protein
VNSNRSKRTVFGFIENHKKPFLIDASLEAPDIETASLNDASLLRTEFDVHAVSVNLSSSGEPVLVAGHDHALSLNQASKVDGAPHHLYGPQQGGIRLRELFEARPNARFQIDIAGTSPLLLTQVGALITLQGLEAQVCLGSRFDAVADLLVEICPFAPLFFPRIALARWSLRAKLYRSFEVNQPYQVLNFPMTYEGLDVVDEQFVDLVRKAGLWLNVRLPRDPKKRAELLQLNVDGIIFDKSDGLRLAQSIGLRNEPEHQPQFRRTC